MYSPRSDTSSDSHYSDATLVDPVRDSIFSAGNTTLVSHHHHHHSRSSPHDSTPSYVFSHLSQSRGEAPIPYLTQPVNPRESNSYRRHGDSFHFVVPSTNIFNSQQSPMPPTNVSGAHQPPAQHGSHLAPGPYVTPYMNVNPVDYLKIKLRRESVSYRNPSQGCLYDVEKENARKAALAALEGRTPRNTAPRVSDAAISSGLVEPDEHEAQPVHPPVYPHSVLPVNAHPYPNDREGAWQVNEPVTLKRQERTRTIKAQYTPEVARIDGGSDYRDSNEGYEGSSRVPQRTPGGDSPHPNALHLFPASDEDEKYRYGTHDIGQLPPYEASQQVEANPIVHYQCKVRRFDITKRRYSDWMGGKVTKPYYIDSVNGVDNNYYYVEFDHPTRGRQEGWFFANREEIKFNPRN